MRKTYSIHKIDTIGSLSFDPQKYSRFKFGDNLIASGFGSQLASGFISDCLKCRIPNEQIVVIPSPYSYIPTATFAMKEYFVFTLNRWLAEHGGSVVQEAKVHRAITYKEDYGELDAEERMKLIGNDRFQIDKEFVQGKLLVFLDDIKITGSHEKMILKMIEEYGLQNNFYLLYFAELTNSEIHPKIENFLNYHYVKSIFDIEEIIEDGVFKFNTRVVKYILNYDIEAFRIFLSNRTTHFVERLYNLSIGNGYHNIPSYSRNLSLIKQHLAIKTINNINYGN